MVILEALSYGTPIISFDIDGLEWLPENCALKVKSYDEKSLGEAIIKITKDSKLQRKMIKKGRKFVNNYSWQKSYENYLSYINQNLMVS